MRTAAWPEVVEIGPGQSGMISVAITNSSSVIDAYRVQVFGLDPSWVAIEPSRLSLFPGDTANVAVNLTLPPDYPSSRRAVTVNVVSDDDPGSFSLNEVELAVRPQTRTTIQIDPTMITAGKRATFGMVVRNEGNAAVAATGYAVDPEDLAEFTFEPPSVVVAPGREQVIEVTAEGGRAWFGPPRPRPFTLGVHAETDVESIATFIQRPRISRWLLTLLGLLTAAAVFAAVLSRSFDRVVDEARVSSAVLDAALSSGEAGGAVVPADPATIKGSLRSRTSGEGFAGATAELFLSRDPSTPVASAATDDLGEFTFSQLGAGTYLLRLSGSGVNQIWFGNSTTAEDATPIKVELKEIRTLPPIEIGGIPVEIAGSVDVDDPSGVVIQLVTPGHADPDTPAVVAEVALGPDGSFVLPSVPSPGQYQMVVSKPGFATETRGIALEPGQPLSGVEISLRPGNGIIEGMVSGPSGPLGGATIIATDGTNEIQTVSLTEGEVGTFALRDLAASGQYTITVSRDGYSSEARTVTITEAQPSTRVDVNLLPATGSISGRALVGGLPARGLTVNISGGDLNRTTAVVSQGASAGTYAFINLPAPRTYTLTFSGAGVIPQVRVVDLDPNNGTQDQAGIDVSLSPETTAIEGIVRDADNQPLARATVRLTDGASERVMLTADEPTVGRFRFTNLAPGAYTLTASRTGAVPVTILVNVSASVPADPITVTLGRQASVSGTITVGGQPPGQTYYLKLYTPELFPITPFTTTQSDPATGRFTFTSLEAPATYVIGIFDAPNAGTAIDSQIVNAVPGIDTDYTIDLDPP